MVHILSIRPRAVCHTPPHFADSLLTAAKCPLTKMGARKDGIVRLRPRVVLLWTPSGHEDARDTT